MLVNVSQLKLNQLDRSFPRTQTPIPEKADILAFFKSFTHPCAIAGMSLYDPITCEHLKDSIEAYEHDGFYWTTEDVLLFKRYDLQLEQSFIDYVLTK